MQNISFFTVINAKKHLIFIIVMPKTSHSRYHIVKKNLILITVLLKK